MAEYIDRDKAIKALIGWETDPTDEDIEYTLNKIPAADVVEVVHGEWVLVEYQSSPFGVDQEYQCSICGTPVDDENYRTRYCPNCGAKMDGERKDNNV